MRLLLRRFETSLYTLIFLFDTHIVDILAFVQKSGFVNVQPLIIFPIFDNSKEENKNDTRVRKAFLYTFSRRNITLFYFILRVCEKASKSRSRESRILDSRVFYDVKNFRTITRGIRYNYIVAQFAQNI